MNYDVETHQHWHRMFYADHLASLLDSVRPSLDGLKTLDALYRARLLEREIYNGVCPDEMMWRFFEPIRAAVELPNEFWSSYEDEHLKAFMTKTSPQDIDRLVHFIRLCGEVNRMLPNLPDKDYEFRKYNNTRNKYPNLITGQ